MKKLCISLCFIVAASLASAGNVFYRYINEQGVVVMDYQVPPELVHKGYEIISAQGQVIDTVPAYNPENKLNAKELESREEQRRMDLIMLRSYSTLEDLYRARDRKVTSLEQEVSVIEANVRDLKSMLERERKDAANIQRSGQNVSEALSQHIDTLSEQIDDAKNMYQLRSAELHETEVFYRNQIARFRILKGLGEETEQKEPDEGPATDQAKEP